MTPDAQLAAFLGKYTPEIRELAEAALEKMRTRLPGAIALDRFQPNSGRAVRTENPWETIINLRVGARP